MRKHIATPRQRRGVIILLTLFLMVFMISMIALAIDIGYLELAKAQIQDAADAAALAAAAELIDDDALTGVPNMTDNMASTHTRLSYLRPPILSAELPR